jgi:polysaccharide export outer membrane protein
MRTDKNPIFNFFSYLCPFNFKNHMMVTSPFKIVFICLILLSSCKTREKLVYFQTGSTEKNAESITHYSPVFKTDDLLSIVVSSEAPELSAPFNLQSTGVSQASVGYLIDGEGFVSLPTLGKVKMAGKNRTEVTTLIRELLKEYLKNPIVQIQILNYKITVLGEVNNPGTFTIPNERITLLEAIGLAGDLSMTGIRHNVLVIRDENGIKTEHRVDLRSTDLFNSPVYYLTQNDVIYVEPNLAARTQSSFLKTTYGMILSLTTLTITTITLIAR